MAQEPDPLPHGNPALQKERTDLVDDGRSVTDQTGANPMQGLQVKHCSTLLVGTKRMVGRCTASAIASASRKSSLWLLMNGFNRPFLTVFALADG